MSSSAKQDAFLTSRLGESGVSARQLGAALAYHRAVEGRQPLSRTVVELGLVPDCEAARWIAEFQGWRYLSPGELNVEGEAHKALPSVIARSRHALPIARRGGRLVVAVADPFAPQFSQVRHALEGESVEWVTSPQADIDARVAEAYSARLAVAENELEELVEEMLKEAAHTRGLSDIHFIPEDRSCEIRLRVDGELMPWRTIPGEAREAVAAQLKLSSTRGADGRPRHAAAPGGIDVANRLDPQDASAVREYGSKRVSLRYSVVPAINGESIVIRILDQGMPVGSLEGLGMLEDTAVRFRTEIKRPNGIIFLAGPTGHGKSTTLAAAVPILDAGSRRVLSVEDPVEYRLRGVTQVPVTPRMTYAAALRAFLRHNPDTIILGEIRDAETAALAIRLSLTGHLILTTVHANTATQVLSRLLDLDVEASLLAATVRLQVSQRLVKRICPHCRKNHRDGPALADRFSAMMDSALKAGAFRDCDGARPQFYEAGGGCSRCDRTGFAGRLGIFEFRDVRPAVADLLSGQGERFDARAAEAVFSAAMAAPPCCAARLLGSHRMAHNIGRNGLAKGVASYTRDAEVDSAKHARVGNFGGDSRETGEGPRSRTDIRCGGNGRVVSEDAGKNSRRRSAHGRVP